MRLCLLGDPVAHSRSPAIHTAALAACGIEGSYDARRVDSLGFAVALDELRSGDLDGANVTMPHKRRAHQACDWRSPDAERAGAVNTLAWRDGRLSGWNTDVTGLRRILQQLPPAPMVVLGAGGAAAAVLAAGTGAATVAARRPDEAQVLADRFGAAVAPWGATVPGAVVVNATPLGMHGESLPDGIVVGAVALVDLAYGAAITPAVAAAHGRGIPVADGIDILVAQAADAFEIWTGRPAPISVMAHAARDILKGSQERADSST